MASLLSLLAASVTFTHGFVLSSTHFSTPTKLEADSRVFDFTNEKSLNAFERIDDVIMGGVSSSTLRPGNECSIWSGIVRIDGG